MIEVALAASFFERWFHFDAKNFSTSLFLRFQHIFFIRWIRFLVNFFSSNFFKRNRFGFFFLLRKQTRDLLFLSSFFHFAFAFVWFVLMALTWIGWSFLSFEKVERSFLSFACSIFDTLQIDLVAPNFCKQILGHSLFLFSYSYVFT